jgi:hypothetical protein
MAAQYYVLVAPRGGEATHPFQIAFNGYASFARGVTREIDGFRIAEMPQLVIKR